MLMIAVRAVGKWSNHVLIGCIGFQVYQPGAVQEHGLQAQYASRLVRGIDGTPAF